MGQCPVLHPHRYSTAYGNVVQTMAYLDSIVVYVKYIKVSSLVILTLFHCNLDLAQIQRSVGDMTYKLVKLSVFSLYGIGNQSCNIFYCIIYKRYI